MMATSYQKRSERDSQGTIDARLPSNPEAEQQVLGTILYYPECYHDVALHLDAKDFYGDEHRVIFEAMGNLVEQETAINPITVFNEIIKMGKSHEVGDVTTYLFSLLNMHVLQSHVDATARIVAEYAQLRRGIEAAAIIVADGYSGRIDDMRAHIHELALETSRGAKSADLVKVGALVEPFFEDLERMSTMQGMPGVSTGLRDLDRILGGGLQETDLLVLAARPGVGKSTLAATIALNAATHHSQPTGVAVWTLEMGRKQWMQRLAAMHAGIDLQRIRTGKIHDDEWERLIEAMGVLSDAPIFIDDTGGITVAMMRSKLRALMAKQQIGLVIVDYLQMVLPNSGKTSANRVADVGEVSSNLKRLACELNLPVLAVASLSRAVEGRSSKMPQLSDLRESGSIESDADVVMFIYRDDLYNPETQRPNIADIQIAKQRNGPIWEVSLYCKLNEMRFRNLEAHPMTGGEGGFGNE